MHKFVVAAVAASLAAGIAVPAAAQDVAPFTGPRVEALVGFDNLQDGSDGSSDGRSGVVYGGAVGYDIQLGGVVVGAEGEITGSTIKARTRDLLANGDAFRLKAGRDLYVGGRVGFVVNPRAMIYAKAGYTNARVEGRYTSPTLVATTESDLEGFRVGAGAEYNMSPNTYVKAEYRYSNYGNLDGFDIDADRHQVLAGVGFRF